jgi:hypothetical protein
MAMASAKISKSFTLDCEPILYWPNSPAKLVRFEGLELSYLGWEGMTYTLHSEETASVEMVEWDPKQVVGWRDMFSESQLRPNGLIRLAKLYKNLTDEKVCEWVTQNGPLGFQPSSNPVDKGGHFIPYLPYMNNVLIHNYEPIDCIRSAARRAANVVELWLALQGSDARGTGHDSDRAIQSIVTFIDNDPLGGSPVHYRVKVNGEPRSAHPKPKSSLSWRRLANVLLAEYIQDHLRDNVRVALGVQKQNRDKEEENRNVNSPPDWNVKPTWHIGSALTAYYVELLMVMRRFRSCGACGKDISHQKRGSMYCGGTCRSTDSYRRKAFRKKALQV